MENENTILGKEHYYNYEAEFDESKNLQTEDILSEKSTNESLLSIITEFVSKERYSN